MRRIILFILSLLVAFGFSACKESGQTGENPPSGDGGGGAPSQDDMLIRVVLPDSETDSEFIKAQLEKYFDSVLVELEEVESKDREIVIGRCERSASVSAYRALEMSLEGAEGCDAWLIYSKGANIAVAYSSRIALKYSIDALAEAYGKGNIFENADGVIAEDVFSTTERVDKAREEMRDEGFDALEGAIGKDAVDSLRMLYTFYDMDLYLWLADLYDPEIGGFYYSNSARNTVGFLPDIESTVQALQFLNVSGILSGYGNSYAIALRDYPEIRTALLDFAKGLQSSIDGYFYHPQWVEEKLSDSRLGRDLDFATILIEALGDMPLYDTPNGIEGVFGAPGIDSTVSRSTLSESTAHMVSRVLSTSKESLPAHLRSLDAFGEYIESLNVTTDSYSAGNTLASQYGQIRLAGDEYVEYLINYLNRTQDPYTGVWENEVSYSSMNGLMKIGGIYNYYDLPIPNIDAALESTVSILKNPSLTAFSIYDEHVCSVYNPWVILRYLIDSAEATIGDEKVEEMREYIRGEAAELLSVTLAKAAIFKRDNGGFSYLKNSTSGLSQGAPVAVSGAIESDVNATTILSASLVYNIFYALGTREVPLYCEEDGVIFFDELNSLEKIIKDPPKPVEAVKFDDFDFEDDESTMGVVETPANGVSFVIGDTETDSDGKYKWFRSEIVKNPVAGASDSDLVLKTNTYLYPNEQKTVPKQPSYTKFNMGVTDKGGNCHVFDADMMFVSGTSALAQIFFYAQGGNVFSLNVVAYSLGDNEFIKIGENYEGLDGIKDNEIAKLIPFDEWFNLRVEVYKEYSDDGTLGIIGKIFVNGVYAGKCDAGYTLDGAFIDEKISGVSIQHYRYSQTELYFNNVKCEQLNKDYVFGGGNEEPPADNRIADFESGEFNTPYLTNFICSGSTAVNVEDKASLGENFTAITEYTVMSDPKNAANKVLRAVTTGEKTHNVGFTKLTVSNESPAGSTYVFETKLYLGEAKWAGDVTQIHFVNSGLANLVSFRVYADVSLGTFRILENNAGGTGTGAIAEGLPMNSWISLKIEWYKGDSAENTRAKIYVGIDGGEAALVKDIPAYSQAFNTELTQVRIAHQRTNASTLYFDDLSLSQVDRTYSAE